MTGRNGGWELVHDGGERGTLERFKVPGGWVYRSRDVVSDTESMVFVPDGFTDKPRDADE